MKFEKVDLTVLLAARMQNRHLRRHVKMRIGCNVYIPGVREKHIQNGVTGNIVNIVINRMQRYGLNVQGQDAKENHVQIKAMKLIVRTDVGYHDQMSMLLPSLLRLLLRLILVLVLRLFLRLLCPLPLRVHLCILLLNVVNL